MKQAMDAFSHELGEHRDEMARNTNERSMHA